MSEDSKKIRELKKTMRAERNVRIRNRMVVVLEMPRGHSAKTAPDVAGAGR